MPTMEKVKLELNPYNAITVLSFMREFVNEDNQDEYKFRAIHEAVQEYEEEIARKLTNEHWDEIHATNEINQLIGKSPKKRKQ